MMWMTNKGKEKGRSNALPISCTDKWCVQSQTTFNFTALNGFSVMRLTDSRLESSAMVA